MPTQNKKLTIILALFEVNNNLLLLQEIFQGAEEYLTRKETIYIATDEKDKRIFDSIRQNYTVLFLDDFWEKSGIDHLSNRNFIGMVDSIVAAHGRTFTGTWWSTFSAYIVRLRGYIGMPRDSSWYTYPPKKRFLHSDKLPIKPYWMTGKRNSMYLQY